MLMIASTDSLRQQNRALVLKALRQAGSASHTELASMTRLSSASVTVMTADLESEAVIRRLEPVRTAGRGRPRVKFCLNDAAAYLIVARITAEAVEFSLSDYAGTLKDRFAEARPQQGDSVEAFSVRFNKALLRLVERGGLDRQQVRLISITSKGVVSTGLPILLWSPVFGDQQIDFGTLLKADWTAEIKLTSETRFAALAYARKQQQMRNATASRKTLVLSLGNSIGMGICEEEADGRMTAVSPAFSHMVHRTDGPLCKCGESGCVEAYSGFYGILRTALQAPETSIPVSQVPLGTLDKIADQARSGDLHAEFAFRTAAEAIGVGLARVLTLFGQMPVVITGPGVRYLDLMQPTIEHYMRQNLYSRGTQTGEITLVAEEANLVYEGNLGTCLLELDQNVLSHAQGRKIGA